MTPDPRVVAASSSSTAISSRALATIVNVNGTVYIAQTKTVPVIE
jgi:hypothetical protein